MVTMQAPRAFYGHQNRSLVLSLKGQIRYMAVRALRAFIDDLTMRGQHDTIIIDLREIEAIDSTGMGLLARLGKRTLQRGRRSIIVCPIPDVMTCLLSAAFDTLFIVEESWPFEEEALLDEIPMDTAIQQPDALGKLMLDAHRDLASLSAKNQREFAGVIAALSAEVDGKPKNPCD